MPIIPNDKTKQAYRAGMGATGPATPLSAISTALRNEPVLHTTATVRKNYTLPEVHFLV